VSCGGFLDEELVDNRAELAASLSFDDVVEADDSVALPVTVAASVGAVASRRRGGYESTYFQTSQDTTKKPMTVPQ
jgi:hypothetical protein